VDHGKEEAMTPVADPHVPEFVKRLQRIDTYAEVEEIMRSSDFMMAPSRSPRSF
jgi:hypothetical protein